MKPYRVSASVTIDRPAAEVHALVDDLSAHERWTDHYTEDWQLLSEVRQGVGARVSLHAKGSMDGPTEVEIVESTPTRIVEEGHGGKDHKRRSRVTYELRPLADDRTLVTFTAEMLEPANPLEHFVAPFTQLYLRQQCTRSLERLRALLESHVVA
jgi:uncharacterized membrane protein